MQSKGHKADFAHFLIESGEQILSLLWPEANARRAASLEIIARTAYTAEESACHYLETIGLDQSGSIRKTLELARRQDSNEQTHEDIFARDLGGLSLWIDRFVARHVAVFVYWIFAFTTLLDHEFASLLGEAVEAEAVKTYQRMLLEQPEEWLEQPATPIAKAYWKEEGNMWAARNEDEPQTLRDVIELIAKDESDHVVANSQKAIAF
tara:strand:- start:205 stop:828 length:624 start_codon:yes stop_codon:yes gene_type:complete